uniref:ATPase_AAA_core domain-containing protein n=1 Tax=Heterorhabditis bacteriophora TaxID=37862 RepID=A0A1I7WCJ5_HETBA
MVCFVFDRARQASPCVVFFDELDSLAPNRGLHGDSGGVMDSLHQSSYLKVFVMAATNRADLIDPSLLTPGRFDKVINVYPGRDIESKIKILEAVSRGVRLSNDVKLDVISLFLLIYFIKYILGGCRSFSHLFQRFSTNI